MMSTGTGRLAGGLVAAVLALSAGAPSVMAIDAAHQKQGKEMIGRAIAWLRTQQDEKTGGWAVDPSGKNPAYPAITGLIVTGMLMDPRIDADDPSAAKGIAYILSFRQPDGGIYDRVLASYNTAICLSALALVERPAAAEAIPPAIRFLKQLQWSEDALDKPGETGIVQRDHPFYGGVGYGRNGRPDNSNLGFFVQALHDAGLATSDPAYERALVFLQRTQMDERVNDAAYAKGSSQGGFIYATSESKDKVGEGQSQAPPLEITGPDGEKRSQLRAYGSMTYSGFKSMIYADLPRDDERVKLAREWIRRSYTVKENPGAGTDGVYYYYLTFARAMEAWGEPTITPLAAGADGGEIPGAPRDWANDLIDQLATMQSGDGSFKPVDDRWMENNPVLITAYSLIALQEAVD